MRMFNYIIHSNIFKRTMAFASTCLLLSLSPISWAGECRINDGYGGTTTLVNSQYSGATVRLPPPIGYSAIASFIVNLTPGIQGKCGAGNDGYNLLSQTNPELFKREWNGSAMFETNIPGIYYLVRVRASESGGAGGYFTTNTTGWATVAGSDRSDPWDEKWLNTQVDVFISDGYVGNPNKITVIKPKAGTLGKMALGNDPNDSNNKPYTFMVNENSFQIPIVLPTCDIAMLSDGTDTVNLGDYFVSDIKNNNVKDVPFSIHLNSCTSTTKFTTKLTTTTLTGTGNDLLGNTLTSGAEGAGVRIMYNGNSQLIPNNANSTYIMTDNTVPGSTQIDYVAQLVANGSTVKPGAFKATGVFTLSYD